MSWKPEMKSQFSVYVLCSDVDKGAALKASLAQDGFDTFLLTDADTVQERMKQNPCHVLVFTPGSLHVPLEDFVRNCLEASSEVRLVPVVSSADLSSVVRYRGYNFTPPVIDGEGVNSMLCWTVEEACQALYLMYLNEQILEVRNQAIEQSEFAQSSLKVMELKNEAHAGGNLMEELKKYARITSKEEVMSIFFREINQKFLGRNIKVSAIFFKYLPTVQSFVAMQSLGIELDSLKGIGGRLTAEEAHDPESMFEEGRIPQALQDLMRDGLKAAQPFMKLIFIRGALDGVLAVWGADAQIHPEQIENEFSLFSLVYERGHLLRLLTSLDMADTVTELHGRHFYLKHLADEVARARRLQKAVSVIKISVDHLLEVEQTVGKAGRDQILKTVASLVQKTSRINDLTCRTGDNEFSLILPHAARKGASLRAERLRRMLEAQLMKMTPSPVTVSCGVGEYPSHCSSFEDLEKVAIQALEYIRNKGGNKVCLFQPADTFRPDYDVPPL